MGLTLDYRSDRHDPQSGGVSRYEVYEVVERRRKLPYSGSAEAVPCLSFFIGRGLRGQPVE
jgi:hypothetical protein